MAGHVSALVVKNSHHFTNEELRNYTRIRAFEGIIPKTKAIENYQICTPGPDVEYDNPVISNSIPSTTNLQKWRLELLKSPGKCIRIQRGGRLVYFNLESVEIAKLLHSIQNCKYAVERELSFFASPKNTPRSVSKVIDDVAMSEFRELVHNSNSSQPLHEFNMLPGELAALCGRRYLYDVHLMWLANQLNNMQFIAHVVFANFITDIEAYCMNRMKSDDFSPSKLVLIFNIGTTDSGHVFISGERQGNHFTIAVYDDETEKVVYGDSLGWKYPDELPSLVNRYVKCI